MGHRLSDTEMDSESSEDAALLALMNARPRGAVAPVADIDEASSEESEPLSSRKPAILNNAGERSKFDVANKEENVAESDADTVSPPASQPHSSMAKHFVIHEVDSDADTISPDSSPRAMIGNSDGIGFSSSEIDIVKLNSRGIAELENEPVQDDEEDPHRNQWVHPRVEMSSCVFDSDACDLLLSNLEPSERVKPSPVGVLPARVNRYLHKFQRDGVTFLYRLYERGRGGLLADAMGLGKTVQMICFLGSVFAVWDRDDFESAPGARILIVVPSSVTENWRREFERWTPFRVSVYASSEQSSVKAAIKNDDIDVVIVGETVLRNELSERGTGFFAKVKWHIMVIDEVQVAKNKNTSTFQAFHGLKVPYKYGMTGAAVQNKLKELWTIMDLLVGPSSVWPDRGTFRRLFEIPITSGAKSDATPFQRQRAVQATLKLRSLLEKHIMRRPKSVIQDQIPGKSDSTVLIRMKEQSLQGQMWKKFINSYDAQMCRNANQSCDCGSGVMSKLCCHEYPKSAEQLENAPIWRLCHPDGLPCSRCPGCLNFRVLYVGLQIARHALLLVPDRDDEKVDDEQYHDRVELVKYYSTGRINERTRTAVLENEPGMSCKLDCALELIKSFRTEKHKTIVFYENLRLGAILQRWATYKGLKYERIDGSVDRSDRQKIVDRFQSDVTCTLFFVSKRAGGTGLNITSADRVLIFEPCWNPTLDLQAQDRAHRLGQKRVVKVFRLVVHDSIEYYQFRTAIAKQQLSNVVLDNTSETWYFKGKELGNMYAMLRIGNVFKETFQNEQEFKVVATDGMHDAVLDRANPSESLENEDWFIEQHDVLLHLSSTDVDIAPDDLEFHAQNDLKDNEVCKPGSVVGASERAFSPRSRENAQSRQGLNSTGTINRHSSKNMDVNIGEIGGEYGNYRDTSIVAVRHAENTGMSQISETQEEDALFHQMNADARLVMSSTLPRHQHSKQLMCGQHVSSGGLNVAGADDIDFEGSSLEDGKGDCDKQSMRRSKRISGGAEDILENLEKSSCPRIPRRRRRSRIASVDDNEESDDTGQNAVRKESKEAKILPKDEIIDKSPSTDLSNFTQSLRRTKDRSAEPSRSRPGTRSSNQKTTTSPSKKPRSAFSARARIR